MTCEYLREFSKKFETVLMGYPGAGGKLVHEKKTRSKKSRDTVPLRAFAYILPKVNNLCLILIFNPRKTLMAIFGYLHIYTKRLILDEKNYSHCLVLFHIGLCVVSSKILGVKDVSKTYILRTFMYMYNTDTIELVVNILTNCYSNNTDILPRIQFALTTPFCYFHMHDLRG